MDGVRVFNSFSTLAFLEGSCVYRTDRIWKPVGRKLEDAVGGIERGMLMSCNIPGDLKGISAGLLEGRPDIMMVEGVTETIGTEGYTCTSMSWNIDGDGLKNIQEKIEYISGPLEELATAFDVEIVITKKPAYYALPIRDSNVLYLHVLGENSRVTLCEPQLRAFLDLWSTSNIDSQVQGKVVESMQLDSYSLLPLLMGVERANFRYITRLFKTSIRAPALVKLPPGSKFLTNIYVSGASKELVQLSHDILQSIVEPAKIHQFYHRLIDISPGKLLFIQKYCQDTINDIMLKYQTYIRVTTNFVEFQSPCQHLLTTVIKKFTMDILHEVVEVQVSMVESFHFFKELITKHFLQYGKRELVVVTPENGDGGKGNNQLICIGFHTEKNLLRVDNHDTSILSYLDSIFNDSDSILSTELKQLRVIFQIYPGFEDFISGKKNGKLTRIMEASDCSIRLEMDKNDESIYLNLISDTFSEFEKGFKDVLNELPAEESFFIPESYHRPIIGSGGSLIQATMKRHNVFIQFFNSFNLPQNSTSFVRYDNVIIRCPRKNRKNISAAKKELKDIVNDYSKWQPQTLLNLSSGQYIHLLSINGKKGVIAHIEKSENVYVMLPLEVPDPAQHFVLHIKGNSDYSLKAAEELIKTSFGYEYELKLEKPLTAHIIFEFYNFVTIHLKKEMGIESTICNDLIRLTYARDCDVDVFEKAVRLVVEFLESKSQKIVSKKSVDQFIVGSTVSGTDEGETRPEGTGPIEQSVTASNMPGNIPGNMPGSIQSNIQSNPPNNAQNGYQPNVNNRNINNRDINKPATMDLNSKRAGYPTMRPYYSNNVLYYGYDYRYGYDPRYRYGYRYSEK